jgi:hypothetical protein
MMILLRRTPLLNALLTNELMTRAEHISFGVTSVVGSAHSLDLGALENFHYSKNTE